MADYQKFVDEDVRLIILRALAEEADYSLNETMLAHVLESFAHIKSRDYIREQLKWLEGADAVTSKIVGSVMIATITRRGRDHVEQRALIENVKRPSPGP